MAYCGLQKLGHSSVVAYCGATGITTPYGDLGDAQRGITVGPLLAAACPMPILGDTVSVQL